MKQTKFKIPPHSLETCTVNFSVWHLFKEYLHLVHELSYESIEEFEALLFDEVEE